MEKLFEKKERTRCLLCSISSGLFLTCLLNIVFRIIGTTAVNPEEWYLRLLIKLAQLGKAIPFQFIILGLIISFVFFVYLFLKKEKDNLDITTLVPIVTREDNVNSVRVNIKRSDYRAYDSDLIPDVVVWVGRTQELELLESIRNGVTVITGFGGQGKSSLAAKCVRDLINADSQCAWDWRDCKEESDRFRTQLIAIISSFTDGEFPVDTFSEASVADISRAFFKLVGDQHGVIVFDNVDYYVDTTENLFTSDVSCFINEALRVEHNFLIILTCRPRVSYPSSKFREIYLRGFSYEESYKLFDKKIPGGVKGNLASLIKRFHEFSEGHPLWLDIIASQIARKPESAEEILREMEAGHMDDRAKSMLRSIWKSLNENQKNILRCMAEVQRSVEEEKIYEFMKGEIANQNRFNRAFKGLKAINIIIERTGVSSCMKKYDLHPMVRAFIRDEFPSNIERKRYISMILKHYDNIILVSRNGTKSLSTTVLEELVTKVELELECGDIKSAIHTIEDTSDDFIERGLHEEYIRLAKKAFNLNNWENSSWHDDDKFIKVTDFLIKTMTEVGQHEEVINFLEIFTRHTPAGTSRFISICDLNCYVNWFNHDYDKAIEWGRRGETLKKTSGLDTNYDTSHNLALALRDSGQTDDALKIFLHGLSLEEILKEDHNISKRDASFYGNIGRCVGLNKNNLAALRLYLKSYELLEADSGSRVVLNKGYASFWIAETLYNLGRYSDSYFFAKKALRIWAKRAPLLSCRPENLLEKLKDKVPTKVVGASDTDIEIYCSDLANNISTGAV